MVETQVLKKTLPITGSASSIRKITAKRFISRFECFLELFIVTLLEVWCAIGDIASKVRDLFAMLEGMGFGFCFPEVATVLFAKIYEILVPVPEYVVEKSTSM